MFLWYVVSIFFINLKYLPPFFVLKIVALLPNISDFLTKLSYSFLVNFLLFWAGVWWALDFLLNSSAKRTTNEDCHYVSISYYLLQHCFYCKSYQYLHPLDHCENLFHLWNHLSSLHHSDGLVHHWCSLVILPSIINVRISNWFQNISCLLTNLISIKEFILFWEALHQNSHQKVEEDIVAKGHKEDKVKCCPVSCPFHPSK